MTKDWWEQLPSAIRQIELLDKADLEYKCWAYESFKEPIERKHDEGAPAFMKGELAIFEKDKKSNEEEYL